jgi:hypothetical protein
MSNNKKLYVEITSGEESYYFTVEEALGLMAEEYARVKKEKKGLDRCPYEWDFKWLTEDEYNETQSVDKPTPTPLSILLN